jgi:tight adherence protein B
MNLQLILPGLIAAGVGLIVFVLFISVRFVVDVFRRRRARRCAEALLADKLAEHLAAVQPPRSLGERLDRAFERLVGRSALALTASQAGAMMLLVGVVVGIATYQWREQEFLTGAATALAMLLLLSFFWLMHWRWRRRMQEQLPDTFHLLARSLRAGLTVDQSVALIGTQGLQPVAAEFQRCSERLKLGMTVPAAMEMTGARIGLVDFDLLVALVSMHRETGGNLALLVDRLATAVRSRNHFRGHVIAVTALSRVTGLAIALAPPILMLVYYLIYPDYVTRLTQSAAGLQALMTALVLEVIGVAWLAWLLRVDY